MGNLLCDVVEALGSRQLIWFTGGENDQVAFCNLSLCA